MHSTSKFLGGRASLALFSTKIKETHDVDRVAKVSSNQDTNKNSRNMETIQQQPNNTGDKQKKVNPNEEDKNASEVSKKPKIKAKSLEDVLTANETNDVDSEYVNPKTGERGGPKGPEPTRFGDWERNGRVSDF